MLISNFALWPPSHIQSSDQSLIWVSNQRTGSSVPPAWYRQALEALNPLYSGSWKGWIYLFLPYSYSRAGQTSLPQPPRPCRRSSVLSDWDKIPNSWSHLQNHPWLASFKPPTWLSRSNTSELVRDHGPLKAQIYGTVYLPWIKKKKNPGCDRFFYSHSKWILCPVSVSSQFLLLLLESQNLRKKHRGHLFQPPPRVGV